MSEIDFFEQVDQAMDDQNLSPMSHEDREKQLASNSSAAWKLSLARRGLPLDHPRPEN